jgi:hypothetical protein
VLKSRRGVFGHHVEAKLESEFFEEKLDGQNSPRRIPEIALTIGSRESSQLLISLKGGFQDFW